MTDNDTMLGYLAPCLSERIEDIAVEALGYILNHSTAARRALDSVVGFGAENVKPVCEVKTQVIFDDWSRVDLVGIDEDGAKHVLIEAKFWADLTSRQPNAYLKHLPESGRSVLLFLAPKVKLDDLWSQLRSRAQTVGTALSDVTGEGKCARVNDTDRYLMLVSWETLLNNMAAQTKSADESDAEADIRQLRGLADRASTPPEPELVFKRIVDEAIDRGVGDGWADKTGLNIGRRSASYPYGRYFRFSGVANEFWLGIDSGRWEETGSPLWLDFMRNKELFGKIRNQLPEGSDEGLVPIPLKTGAEHPEVLNDVASQLKTIAELVRAAG